MRNVDWYFDFVSPFAYLALHRLKMLGPDVTIAYRPVLFAGLLNHFGQKGPAEIPAKRQWTYRWCTWWAARHGIAFRFPASHPFNPLPHLRLAIAGGCKPTAIEAIFREVWTTGRDPMAGYKSLCAALGVSEEALASDKVKGLLRSNTERAAEAGVFGVPTLVVDGEAFWGVDGLEFAADFVANPAALRNPEIERVDALPVGAARKP